MDSKHTPGPWESEFQPGSPYAANGGSYVAFVTGAGTNIADVCDSAGMTTEQAEAAE